jgi:hypothetical protein
MVDHKLENGLPAEITQKIKPKAYVGVGGETFYCACINNYIESMKSMTFNDVIRNDARFKESELFFQIFQRVFIRKQTKTTSLRKIHLIMMEVIKEAVCLA